MVIHQLPRTTDTLWLRILGRDKVQAQAIDELLELPEDNPLRANTLELLSNLRVNLEVSENVEEEDRELIMRLSPLYLERLADAWREGEQQGIEQGIQIERRKNVENLLRYRFGNLDEQLAAIIEPMLLLPNEEFTLLLMQLSQLSREELLTRFVQ